MKIKKLVVLALAATFFGVSISSLAEEIESRKLSILEANGNYTYVKKANGREFKAIKGMGLAQGNEVITGKDSKIYIEADEDKVIRLDENTIVEISKASAKSLNLKLHSGNLFFNVDKPLGSDENMTFEAAHTSMSIRGTSGVFSFNPLKMEFFLVEGSVKWDLGDGNIVEIKAGEAIQMERDASTLPLGPGADAEAIYTFTKKVPFQWTDLDDDGLEAIMENRALLDLTSIGLDTPEEIKQAADKVEEYRKAQELEKINSKSNDDDNNDDFYEPETSPSEEETTEIEESSLASDSDAGETSGSVETESSSEDAESGSQDAESGSQEAESGSKETESSSSIPTTAAPLTKEQIKDRMEQVLAEQERLGKIPPDAGNIFWDGTDVIWIDGSDGSNGSEANAVWNSSGYWVFDSSWLSQYGYEDIYKVLDEMP